MTTAVNPTLIVAPYKKIISGFKKRGDVQNGNALGYRKNQNPEGELLLKNKPKGLGDGLATTGWCVSASQAFLLDPIFQTFLYDRGAVAKLVSIDIKEQYYGTTYSGNQNKWHTAILVKDTNYNFIIDLTCSQFGNNFTGKDIWDFKTWELKLRNPNDKHIISDFEQNVLTHIPKQIAIENSDLKMIDVQAKLKDITTINDAERKVLSDFFLDKINTINTKLILGNVNKFDFDYIKKINALLEHLDFEIVKGKSYSILSFANKDNALSWVKKFVENNGISEQYLLFSNSLLDYCKYFNINVLDVNTESMKNAFYIIIEIEDLKGMDISFIPGANIIVPFGIKFNFSNENIFNGGKYLDTNIFKVEKKTNTIYIQAKI